QTSFELLGSQGGTRTLEREGSIVPGRWRLAKAQATQTCGGKGKPRPGHPLTREGGRGKHDRDDRNGDRRFHHGQNSLTDHLGDRFPTCPAWERQVGNLSHEMQSLFCRRSPFTTPHTKPCRREQGRSPRPTC